MRAFGFGFALVAMLLLLVVDAQKPQRKAVITAGCNPEKIPTSGIFFYIADALLANLETNTATNGYSYKTSNPAIVTAYGEATCSPTSASDCTACLGQARNAIWHMCDFAVGARIQYGDGCYMRYEQYNF